MTTYTFVTTFSRDGWECYGRDFVKSWLEHSGDNMHLVIYHESQPDVEMWSPRLTWVNLDADPDRERFIEDWGQDADKVGSARDPNSQAIRFCHKVFALTDAAKHVREPWLIWCDADVRFHSAIEPHMDSVCRDGTDVAYLGRVSAPYTECGFVAYRIAANPVKSLLSEMRDYYVSGRIFEHPRSDWHDSRCFDIALENSDIATGRRNNLSEGLAGWHVWPHTVLAKFSTHQKGPRRKHEAYGSVVK